MKRLAKASGIFNFVGNFVSSTPCYKVLNAIMIPYIGSCTAMVMNLKNSICEVISCVLWLSNDYSLGCDYFDKLLLNLHYYPIYFSSVFNANMIKRFFIEIVSLILCDNLKDKERRITKCLTKLYFIQQNVIH